MNANNRNEYVRRASVSAPDESLAVATLVKKLDLPELEAIIFYCPSDCDLPRLASAMKEHFECTVLGCTSAATISGCYDADSIVAVALSSRAFRVHSRLIEDLDDFNAEDGYKLMSAMRKDLVHLRTDKVDPDFGLLLVDSMSMREEQLISALYSSADGMPIVGGSASDKFEFDQTLVYLNGQFRSGCAVFSIIETTLDFQVFKRQHFEATDSDLVITEADADKRIVSEINGAPAVEEYANLVGMDTDELCPKVFSRNPLMLELGNHWYVRSVEKANEDGSLSFFCAIDEGLPLTLAKRKNLVDDLKSHVNDVQKRFSQIDLTLGFDCVQRGLELEEDGLDSGKKKLAGQLLESVEFIGFSTFGEQFNGMHVNHTLVSITLGEYQK